ncbi:DUF58 domain-containing protein [Paenibacillus arenilitoris]|uniref:DUF58 domain-containing protein n=1 Tax=Paenibacillus arenilitoris TaxID=2772299 RepID=A0A927CV99_9BACL|nr:DUF58 domain-containing protein [Paenibacillus arenilitoris]MBD2872471.1 DUF58 domain-containing protein [Paenibacillus arenilitoris]
MGMFTSLTARILGIAFLFTASLFFLLFQGGKLAFMVFTIVGSLCIYLMLGRWSGISRARVLLSIPDTEYGAAIEAGTSVSVNIQVHIPGLWPIPYVKVKERLFRQGREEHVLETFLIPDWKRRAEVSCLTPPLRRGIYRFEVTDCSTEDIFGLFQHKGHLRLPYDFKVQPQRTRIREWKELHQRLPGGQFQTAKTRSHRESTQLSGVRDYINGDRLSRIHWRATAKTGTWKSKEYEREAAPKIVIILDRSIQAYDNNDHYEMAVSITASILEYAASRELAIELVSAGKNTTYFEQSGAIQQNAIMNHLIDTEPDGVDFLLDMLRERVRLFTPGSFLVVVSPQYGHALSQTLAWLEQRRMKTCHMWVAAGVPKTEQEHWKRHLQTARILGYEITSLDELSLKLGGVMK